ncbi:MAG: ATP-dependent RecD-like DNA helicase [Clostridiaceae bacterium]|nr:ATP-dependent RecD-like DNA helicase [Clostridiaceae bacterium]
MVELEGKLIEIIYQNESNGYTVAVLDTPEDELTIVGYLPTLKEGEQILVKGDWKVHHMYGQQLEVKEYRPIIPSSEEGIINYLSSGIITGIGKKMAKRIVEHFGKDAMDIIEYHPHRLTEVPGIGKSKAETIAEAFQDQRELREIILFLSQYAISPNYAVKIYKKYGKETISTIQENPYRLAEDITGIGFIIADRIAKAMGIDPNSKYRIYAGTKYMLNTFSLEGHTYAPKNLLVERTAELIGAEAERVEDAIQGLALGQSIQLEKHQEEMVVYAMPYYYAESNVCKKLIELSRVQLDPVEVDLEEELQLLQQQEGISLAKNQKEAIKQAVENGLLVITGGPGTGKTTTINTLIKMFEKLKMKITLAAPTGRASKRMTEATGKESKTIHRLLELGFSEDEDTMMFQRDEDNPLDSNVIIIDEVSMVDILLMNSLMKAVAPGTRLVLVGDVDQLPSVGAGNVLKDIIDSRIVKVVRLNEVFRQAQESMIVVNAHKINRGQHPLLNQKDKDFYFITKHKKEEVLTTLLQLVKERLPKHYKFDPRRDIQVLTPMKKGEVGTINLNKELQQGLNPPSSFKQEREVKEKVFRVGDKVMQMKNNYTLKWKNQDPEAEEDRGEGVFNGDIGYVQSVDTEDQELSILFDDNRLVTYNFSQLEELELAYCITIHKSQGSEFPVVVMPITWGPPMLLTRNLLYTAITRAKKLVVLVGTENYLNRMVQNNKVIQRYSGLGYRLGKFYEFHTKKS